MQITPQGDNFYLSAIGGDRALTPPKRHSLGKPLPYQLADTPQAHPKAINLSPEGISGIIPDFSGLCPTLGKVPTCYYLVRRGSKPTRLACLIHVASVHPELGSNSKKEIFYADERHKKFSITLMNGTKEKMIRRSFLETCCVVFLYLITILPQFSKNKTPLKDVNGYYTHR